MNVLPNLYISYLFSARSCTPEKATQSASDTDVEPAYMVVYVHNGDKT